MARGKNEVVLTFSGDSKDLEKSFDRVGGAAKDMGRDVDQVGDRFQRTADRADVLDTRAMGFRDTVTGVQDTFQAFNKEGASLQERILLLGMGFGDLASGVANFGTQFFKTVGQFIATQARMVAVHLANAARMAAGWLIALGPIALVVAAIAGIIAILVALGVNFEDVKNAVAAGWEFIRNAAVGVFNWIKTNWPLVLAIITGPIGLAVLAISRHWSTIRSGFSSAMSFVRNVASSTASWIIGRFNGVVSFFSGLPGRVASIFGSIGRSMGDALKRAWNSTIGGRGIHIPSVGVGPFRTPGLDITIPRLHQGGIFPGAPGTEGLAVLQAGERVIRSGAATQPAIVINVAGSIRSDRDLVRLIRDELDRGGLR